MKINEIFNDKLVEVKEASDEDGMVLSADFAQADVKNKNGRFYPESVLQNSIEKLQKKLQKEHSILASSGHKKTDLEIPDISHLIQSVWYDQESKTGRCNIKVISTENGKQVKTIIKNGGSLGLSLSGIGSTTKVEGVNRVNSDFELTGISIVVNPGFEGARFNSSNVIGESWNLDRAINEQTLQKERGKIIDGVKRVESGYHQPTQKQLKEKQREMFLMSQKAGCKMSFDEYIEKMHPGEEIDKELKTKYRNAQKMGTKLTFAEYSEKFGKK